METKKCEKIKISTEYITLGQFLKFAGVIDSGFLAKEFIMDNDCFVNYEKCIQRGKKLYPGYMVSINGNLFFEIIK